VKDYQIQGPDWLNSTRFDVAAKVPLKITEEQGRQMIQKLLADRFNLTIHHDSKEHNVFALVVAKGGPKLKESDPNDDSPMKAPDMNGPGGRIMSMSLDGPGRGAPPPPPPPPGGEGRGGASAGRGGGMMMSPGHLQAKKSSMTQLVTMLSMQVDRPVVDETKLTGMYDYSLDYAPEPGRGMMGGMGGMGGGTMGGMVGAAAASGPPPSPDGGDAPSGLSLSAALEKQLGLKLEPRKLPMDMIVVDHMEKVPSEN
jgi:uncharacterized protein (TIGR03435 family)